MKVAEASGEKVIRTVCLLSCGNRCGILAHVRDGVLVKVEPADFPDSKYRHICAMGLCTPKLVYHPDRLKYPMKRAGKRGEGKWQRISWNEALDTVASRFSDIQNKYGPESVAWAASGMAAAGALSWAYLRFANACQGTWVDLGGPGDSAGYCADLISYGVKAGQLLTVDFERPGLYVLWGENTAVTFNPTWCHVREAKERGAKLVVIDPCFTPTACKADEYISIRPGTDAALALGMMNVILDKGLYDRPFVVNHTVGPFLVRSDTGLFVREKDIASGKGINEYLIWDTKNNKPQAPDVPGVVPALRGAYVVDGIEYKPAFQLLAELTAKYPLEKASEITGVDPDVIRRLAIDYVTRKPVATTTGFGTQRTFHGDLSWRAITTLAAITGNMSLKGQRWLPWKREAAAEVPGRSCKRIPLLQLYETILTNKPNPIKALWIAKHNFVNQIPNTNKVIEQLLPSLEFIVVADIFMNASAQYADIILPVCTFFECTDLVPTTPINSYHHYLQLQQKVVEPLYESKPDFQILSELATRMGFSEFFNKNDEEYIEQLLHGYLPIEVITLKQLKEGPVFMPPQRVPAFTTPSRRFEFYSEELKRFGQELPIYLEPLEGACQPLAQKYPLSYLQTHSRFRTHSQLTNIPWLLELDPGPKVEMNPIDADKRGIKDGDMVVVFNDRGQVKVKVKIHEGIRPGVVNITQGWWPKHYAEGSHQALTHDAINPAQQSIDIPNPAYFDNLVEVRKAEDRRK